MWTKPVVGRLMKAGREKCGMARQPSSGHQCPTRSPELSRGNRGPAPVFLGIVVVALVNRPDTARFRGDGAAAMLVFHAIFYCIGAQLTGSRASTLDDTLRAVTAAGRGLVHHVEASDTPHLTDSAARDLVAYPLNGARRTPV